MKDMPHEELAGVFHHPCQSQGREVSGGKFYIRSYLFVYVLDKQKPSTGTIPHNLQKSKDICWLYWIETHSRTWKICS